MKRTIRKLFLDNSAMASSSILSKKKMQASGCLTRTRFTKPQPNIGALTNKASRDVATPKVSKTLEKREEKDSETKQDTLLPIVETAGDNVCFSQNSEIPSTSCKVTENEVFEAVSSLNLHIRSTPEEKLNNSTPFVKSAKGTPSRSQRQYEAAFEKESLSIAKMNKSPNSLAKNVLGSPRKRLISEKTPKPRKKFKNARESSPASGSTMNCEPVPYRIIDEMSSSNSIPAEESIDDPPPYVSEEDIAHQHSENHHEIAIDKESLPAEVNDTIEREGSPLKNISNSPRKRVTPKKPLERRKRFTRTTEAPPRSEMKMVDLIHYNPSGAEMKYANSQTSVKVDEKPNENSSSKGEEDHSSVPKVVIGENGEIIIDEASLVIRRKEEGYLSTSAVVENDNTTYSSFRKKLPKKWTYRETVKFYKALSFAGTDFALMEIIFKDNWKIRRSRHELKLKFKHEERLHAKFVFQAMYKLQTWDISTLDDDSDDIVSSSEVEDEPPKSKNNTESSEIGNKGNEGEEESISSEGSSTDDETGLQ